MIQCPYCNSIFFSDELEELLIEFKYDKRNQIIFNKEYEEEIQCEACDKQFKIKLTIKLEAIKAEEK